MVRYVYNGYVTTDHYNGYNVRRSIPLTTCTRHSPPEPPHHLPIPSPPSYPSPPQPTPAHHLTTSPPHPCLYPHPPGTTMIRTWSLNSKVGSNTTDPHGSNTTDLYGLNIHSRQRINDGQPSPSPSPSPSPLILSLTLIPYPRPLPLTLT